MKLLIKLKKADEYANKIHSNWQKSFFGKIALKLISEITLACLIAAAVYLATNAYHTATAVSDDIKKINQVYISMSEEYADLLFGAPYISFVDENDLENNFYILNKSILRTVVDKNNIVAFFITSTDIKVKIPVNSISDEAKEIGKVVYSDIDFPNPQIEGNINSNGRYVYYNEIQGTGRYAMYNNYIFGFLPYGFTDNSTPKLINLVGFEGGNTNTAQLNEIKKKAKPNTFGVVAPDCQELVSILPICDEWENVYYLLTKASYSN